MTSKPDAPAARRNRQAILDVIEIEFRQCESVLEIGSGTGQHAIFFAQHLPWLTWQTSDRVVNHEGIHAWLEDAQLGNLKAPLGLDVEQPMQFDDKFDAVFSANTAHIMSIAAVEAMFGVVAASLASDGIFCLYGPFNQNGEFTSDSNRQFDASLRESNSAMGIRGLEDLDRFAADNEFCRKRLYAMPANNMIVVWARNPVIAGSAGNDNL